MALPKLAVITPQEGYSFDEGDAILRAKVSSGPSRLRLDMLDAPRIGSVTLVLGPDEYGYWRSFYRFAIKRGVLPFLMDLVIDSSAIEECRVQITPGSIKTNIQGTAHIVQMELEVTIPDPTAQDDYDAGIIMLYGIYGDHSGAFLNRLEKLVNFDFPSV